ncbi:MAG TPA: hypothetical protein VK581_03830 [Chthoniobacterales bacterium]|nr:hypothetical protein [Chthoniobacterales bacterium]
MHKHLLAPCRPSLLCALVILLAGCVANRAYRLGELDPNSSDPDQKPYTESHTVPCGRAYDMSFVEFDDKGDFWDRRQLGRTAHQIKDSRVPVLLVIFIHGWHHNAADRKPGGQNPGDVDTFRCLLSQLANSEGMRHMQVHGVYLGWRGRLVQGPLDYLTFLGRKAAATRIAGTPVTETIFELIRQARRNSPGRAKAVVIGHSFGALVLEKAMAQAVAGSILSHDAEAGGGSFTAPADLILLVNSAAESIYAKELSDMFDRIGHRSHVNAKRPLLVSITSETDSGTKSWFPFGTFLPNLFAHRPYGWDKKYNDFSAGVDQNEYLTTTPGHEERLFTHEIVPVGEWPSRKAARPDLRNPATCIADNPAFDENLLHPQGLTFAISNPAAPKEMEWWRFQPLPNRKQRPYWIMHVPKAIIDGHTPIFTAEGRAMMAAIFSITNSEEGPRQMSITSP